MIRSQPKIVGFVSYNIIMTQEEWLWMKHVIVLNIFDSKNNIQEKFMSKKVKRCNSENKLQRTTWEISLSCSLCCPVYLAKQWLFQNSFWQVSATDMLSIQKETYSCALEDVTLP